MVVKHSWVAVLLLAVFVTSSWAWTLPPHQLRRLSSHEVYQRLLTEQAAMADDQATCEEMLQNSFLSDYMMKLPAFGGFQSCVNANLFDLYPAIENSQCSLSTLVSLVSADSKDSLAFMEVMKTLLGGGVMSSSNSSGSVDLKTTLSSWSTNTTKLNGFCNIMNTQAGPCIEALVPALVSLLESGAMCCHELNGYLELLKLVVPTGKTLEQTLIDILNGLHQTMCTTASSDGEICAAPLSSYLSDVITTDESLLGAIIFRAGVPLYAAAENDVCSSLETQSLTSGLANGKSIPYYAVSCCVSGLSKFLQSLDAIMTHLSGNSIAELFTLITGRHNAPTQFASLYPAIESCAFGSTCTNPNFTISVSNTSTNATSWSTHDAVESKTRSPKNVSCTITKLCDSHNVCSEVCEAGTVSIEPWVANAISFQHNLSYAETLCYTQLPATHNSAITQARGYGNRDQLFNSNLNASNADSYMRTSNQFLSLTDQLNLGVRFLELDVHYFASALRDPHCSNLGVSLIETLSTDMVISLKFVLEASGEDTTVEWTPDLVGCLPSLSGIRAEEQRLHNESLAEVATWLASHPNDLVVLFADIGDDVELFTQTYTLMKLYANTFGSLIFTPFALESAGGDWNRFTLEDLIHRGKQVIVATASEANSVMFHSREMCAGWVDIPRNATGPVGTFFGEKMNVGKIVRAFESELHYVAFSESALGGGNRSADTTAQPANVNASSVPVFVDAGVNFVAPDGVDGATMAAMVWSWAENEPAGSATAVELSAIDGRWYGVTDSSSISHVACVNNSNRMTWKVVAKGSNCPSDYATGAPRLAVENAALLSVLRVEGGAATAQLDVDLSSFSPIQVSTKLNADAQVLPAVI